MMNNSRGTVRLFIVVIVAFWIASRDIGLDEPVDEGPEEGPRGWNGHGDQNNPLFDFTPAEKNGHTICGRIG